MATLDIILSLGPVLGIMAIGMGLLLTVRQFDLSIGSIFVLTSVIMTTLSANYGINPVVCIFIALAMGAALGFLNGIIITKTGASSIIVTLGTMWSFQGIGLMISGGYTTPFDTGGGLENIFVGKIGFIPAQFLWLIVITIIAWVVLNRTVFGNRILGTGSTESAAKMMGVNTDRIKIILFMLMGVLAAFAGVMETTRFQMSCPYAGRTYNLKAIAAAVMGGTAITGGVGSVVGCLLGAMFVLIMEVGLIIMGFSEFLFTVALGVVLILAMVINEMMVKRR